MMPASAPTGSHRDESPFSDPLSASSSPDRHATLSDRNGHPSPILHASSNFSRPQSASPRRSRRQSYQQPTKPTIHSRVKDLYNTLSVLQDRAKDTFTSLSPLKKILVIILAIVLFIAGLLILIFNERIFKIIAPWAEKWRDVRAGWLVLWLAIFGVSFPPLIGYGMCVTLAGFVYGIWKGWLLLATATVIGSTASFIASRHLFQAAVIRMTAKNKRFAALNLTLKHDGLKLLIMIRLCPLPYSAANGFLATVPTITPLNFAIATLCMCPKYFIHVFVGSRLAAIAENGDKMDAKTKLVSYLSILIGVVASALTGWFMYSKTAARAEELDALERQAAETNHGQTPYTPVSGGGFDDFAYVDSPDERRARDALTRYADDADAISLRTADGGKQSDYTDDLDDHEPRQASLEDVFAVGDAEGDGPRP